MLSSRAFINSNDLIVTIYYKHGTTLVTNGYENPQFKRGERTNGICREMSAISHRSDIRVFVQKLLLHRALHKVAGADGRKILVWLHSLEFCGHKFIKIGCANLRTDE